MTLEAAETVVTAVGVSGSEGQPRVRRLGTWAATAMVVTEVVGVGIFLTPATMMRNLGSIWAALGVWATMGILTAAAVLKLPRPKPNEPVFRAPLHPLPIAVFLVLIVGVLVLFVVGQPKQTLHGAAVVALGVPLSWFVVPRWRALSQP